MKNKFPDSRWKVRENVCVKYLIHILKSFIEQSLTFNLQQFALLKIKFMRMRILRYSMERERERTEKKTVLEEYITNPILFYINFFNNNSLWRMLKTNTNLKIFFFVQF